MTRSTTTSINATQPRWRSCPRKRATMIEHESRLRARPEDPLEAALAWSEEGDGAALATVIRTWGSSPRPVGSLLAVRGDGAFVGSVSGGCVEGATIEA